MLRNCDLDLRCCAALAAQSSQEAGSISSFALLEESRDEFSVQFFEPKLVGQQFDEIRENHLFGPLVVRVVFKNLSDHSKLLSALQVFQKLIFHFIFCPSDSSLKVLRDFENGNLLRILLAELRIDLEQSAISAHLWH